MTNEIWRDVEGFEDFYAVSNLGRVKSLRRELPDRTISEKIMRGNVKSNGYLHVSLRKPGERQLKRHVHRLVALAFVTEGAGPEVNHKDGDKLNNLYTNLHWCTHEENMAHAWANGLVPYERRSV